MTKTVTDRYHVLAAGEAMSEMLSAYGVDLDYDLPGGTNLAEEMEDRINVAPIGFHETFEGAEEEAFKAIEENVSSRGFFCTIFKNAKLYALVTADGVKTFEVI